MGFLAALAARRVLVVLVGAVVFASELSVILGAEAPARDTSVEEMGRLGTLEIPVNSSGNLKAGLALNGTSAIVPYPREAPCGQPPAPAANAR